MPQRAARLNHFSSAVFYELAELKRQLLQSGREVLDLGIGSPDLPPPAEAVEAFREALGQPGVFGYPTTEGSLSFRQGAAAFLAERYGVSVDPHTELISTMGAQDALAHLALALVDPGEYVLIPDPGYPIYEVSVHLAGGIPYPLPLFSANNFLPELDRIPKDVLQRTKMMILNYPGNPVTAFADSHFFHEVADFAKRYDIVVIHDAAYIELVFDSRRAPSFLSIPGAKDVGIELHSFSKTFNFAGPRLAFAVGAPHVISALKMVKSNIDYGVFLATQRAGEEALKHYRTFIPANLAHYEERRSALLTPLIQSGMDVAIPPATMFVWLKIPGAQDSRAFAKTLLLDTGIISVPGIGFGRRGEGYVRLALVQSAERLSEAGEKIAEWVKK